MRLLVASDLKPAGGIIGAGFDELRWPLPVRPGDELRVESEILEVRPLKSRADRGVVKVKTTTLNQRGANSAAEFTRQRDKLVETIVGLDADALGLMEIENNGLTAVSDLVAAVNARIGVAGTYAVIDSGTPGTDAIKVTVIYKPARLRPIGNPVVPTDAGFSVDGGMRPPVAQRFAAIAAGLALLLASASLFEVLRQGRETRRAFELADARVEQRIAAEGQQREALAQRVGAFEQELETRVASSVSLALAGEATFGTADARVVMDAAGQQVLLLASRIPPLPEGRTYQLWVIVSGARASQPRRLRPRARLASIARNGRRADGGRRDHRRGCDRHERRVPPHAAGRS